MKRISIRNKLKDWYEDLSYDIRHIRGNIRSFFKFLDRWFSYYKVLRKVYDFDYESIIEVERYQLTRVRDDIIKYQNHVNWERDVYWMNMALKLLDIIEDEGGVELVGKGFSTEPYGNGFYRVVDDPDSKWVLSVYVNTANSKRFTPINKEKYEDPKIGSLMKSYLRLEKAWYLYHKLRIYKMRSWWD